MAIEPKRLNGATLAYDTAASVDGDNDLIPVASAANAYKLAKVTPNVLAEAIGADALDAGIAAAAASTSLASTDFLAGQTAAGANIKATTDTLRTYFNTTNGVTVVPSTVTDGAGLQALIDARQAAGGGTVYLPDGRSLTTTQKITIPSGVEFRMSPSAEIVINADVDGIELLGGRTENDSPAYGGGSKLAGGRIRVAQSSYTKACVVLDGLRSGTSIGRFNRFCDVSIRGTTIYGKINENAGTGILMKAEYSGSTGAAVQWVVVDGVNIIDFENGIWLKCAENDSAVQCFVNGNLFSNIRMEDCINFWRFTADASGTGVPAISGNVCVNSEYQVKTTSEKLILVDGNDTDASNRNHFINLGCFDWTSAPAATTVAVDIADGIEWIFVGCGDLDADNFDIDRTRNTLILGDPQKNLLHIPEILASTPDEDAALHINRAYLWRSDASDRRALVYSDGTTWHPLVGTSKARIDYTESRTFDLMELISRQNFAQSTSATDNPTIFDIGTNGNVGCEVHIQRRHATYPLRINMGAVSVYDPFAGTNSTSGQYLSLDTQYAEVILRCIENKNWAVMFKRGTLSYVTP